MKLKIKFIIIIFLIVPPVNIHAQDVSFYTIKPADFSENIYFEKTSTYLLASQSGFTLPDTSCQKIISMNPGKIYKLTVIAGIQGAKKTDSKDRYLENSRLLNLEEPELRNISAEFLKSRNPVNEVERFVNGYITNKRTGLPLLSAMDVVTNRTGDCKGHTVLSVALLRLIGIPAVGVIGMILCREFGGVENVFVYHMWAEAYVNGRWVLVDATRPGEKYPNRYIAFSYHSLRTEMPLDYLKAVSSMKSFSIKYIR